MKEFKKSTAFSNINKEKEKHTHSIEPGGEPIEWQPIHSEEELHLAAKAGGSYYLAKDIDLTRVLDIIENMNLCLNDKVLKQTNSYRNVIYIGEDVIFNLCDCSGDKGTTRYWDKASDGSWELKTDNSTSEYMTVGGVIVGGYSTYCGGVFNYGTFTMYGGNITGNSAMNSGGGVYNCRIFIMAGGSITGNSAEHGGGVYNGYTFTMNGGEITGNGARFNGGGVYNDGPLTMYGGSISGNKVRGSGGGVYNNNTDSTFTMYNGGITGNDAYVGGGMYNYNGTFTLNGGSITRNSGKDGDDIYNERTDNNDNL